MGLFAKVFSSLWEGSMIGKPDPQLVFVFLLAHADRDGLVDVAQRRIAVLTGLDETRVRAAISELEAPDPDSRTAAEDGRRLLRLHEHRDWGWRIVNYPLYRGLRDEEQRREQAREGMRKIRAERAAGTAPADPVLTVSNVNRRYPIVDGRGVDVDTAKASLRDAFPGAADAAGGTAPDCPGSAPSSPVLGPEAPLLAIQPQPAPVPLWRVLIAAGGIDWPVPEPLVREMAALYPGVDVPRALGNMRGYLLTNSRRRPTAGGMPAFMNKWLRKDQDRAAGAGISGRRPGGRGGSDERYEQANRGGGNE